MKGIYKIFCLAICLASSLVLANPSDHAMNKKTMKNQWVCETNASSSSNAADQKADDTMKKARSGKDAFDFAMKHCRDCTKITCNLQTSDQNMNQGQTNQGNVSQ